MEGKRVEDSHVVLSLVMLPQDANPAGLVHGGVIMKQIDNAAGVAATMHTRTVCVTASIDRLDFHNPVHVGNLVTFRASLNLVGSTSMEVGVRVETEDLLTGIKTHTASAYLTFVALGPNFKPVGVPPLITVSETEKRREREAKRRREFRLAEKKKEKLCQDNAAHCN